MSKSPQAVSKGFQPRFQHSYRPPVRRSSVPTIKLEALQSGLMQMHTHTKSLPDLTSAKVITQSCIGGHEIEQRVVLTYEQKRIVQDKLNCENCTREMARFKQRKFAQ